MRILASVLISTFLVGMISIPAQAANTPTGKPVAYAITPKNTITVIDTGSREVLNTITLSGPAGYILGTPDGKQLYVTGVDPTSTNPDGDAVVEVIDTQTDTITATLSLNLFPVGMAISSDGKRVYVATSFFESNGEVAVIDTATNTVAARIPSSQLNSVGIALSPNGTRVYVPMTGDSEQIGALDVIDTVSETLIASLNVPAGRDQYSWAAVSPDSSKVYTYVTSTDADFDTSQIFLVLDAATNQQIDTAPIPKGGSLSTPLPNSSILYGIDGGSVLAFDTQTNKVVATVPVATSVQNLALTPDGTQVYVSNSNAQSIAILDTATNAIIGSVAVAGATGIAIVAAPPSQILTPPVPTLQLSPNNVPPGAQTSIAWTSTGATSCTASGAWSGSVGLQGSTTVSVASAGSYYFTLTCTGAGGTAAVSAKLTVIPGSTLTASATDIPLFSTLAVSWKSFAGATSCGASWTPYSLPPNGSTVLGPFEAAGTQQLSLYCQGPSGNENPGVRKSISIYTPEVLAYTRLTPANDDVYALGAPGVAVASGGLDGHGYAIDASALPNPVTALGQTFTLGAVAKPSGISNQTIALTHAQLAKLTVLETAVNGNQLNQPFVVTYSDGTKTTYKQSVTDWSTYAGFEGEDSQPIVMADRLTSTGAKQMADFYLHSFSIPLDSTKVATSLQLPANRNVVVLAINETKAPQATRESISSAFNVYGSATVGYASTHGGLDGHGYAYDASLLPSGFTGAGQQFTIGTADQPDAVSNSTIALAPKKCLGITVLAAATNGSQPNQTFVVTYQDGSTGSFEQSLSDWHQPQKYPNELVARQTAFRITPTGVRQGGVWDVYAYSFQTDPNKQIVSLTLPKNRHVVVLAVNTLTP